MEPFSLPHQHGTGTHAAHIHETLLDVDHFSAVSDIFRLLSDPTRVRLFWLLSHCEECVVNIAAMLDMSSPAVSHHLHALTEGGLLESRRDGKEVYYRAVDTVQSQQLHETVEQFMSITCPEKHVDYQTSQEEIIRNVHRYLVEHLSERITIEALSKTFLMNSTTLKAVFKQVYGTTISAHIRKHRMEQAVVLLQTTDDDIAAIAHAVGYDSASRFTTVFREQYGQTPSEYRKRPS